MSFISRDFVVFFVVVLAAFWTIRRHPGPRNVLLLVASYFFYGYWDPRFLGLIVFSTALDFFVGRTLGKTEAPRRRKALLTASLIGNLGVLGFFKYWGFFSEELRAGLEAMGMSASWTTLHVVLPVGISFYTFQTLSYTLDVYWKKLEPEESLLRFAVFVAFFPQLVAGPIVRARDFLPQLRATPRLDQPRFDSGLALIFWGFTK